MSWKYCIDCETMHGNNFFPTCEPGETVDCCSFPLGDTACPPPEFDIDEMVESLGYYTEEEEEEIVLSEEDSFWYEAYFAPFMNGEVEI